METTKFKLDLNLPFQGFSLIAFICVTAGAVVCVPWVATTGFFNFVTMAAVVLTLILYVILLLKLQKRIFRCDCVKWPLLVTNKITCLFSILLMLATCGIQ